MSWSQVLRSTRLVRALPSSTTGSLVPRAALCSASYGDEHLEEDDKLGFTNMVLKFVNKVSEATRIYHSIHAIAVLSC